MAGRTGKMTLGAIQKYRSSRLQLVRLRHQDGRRLGLVIWNCEQWALNRAHDFHAIIVTVVAESFSLTYLRRLAQYN
jgi:hypothetical protein